MLGMVNKVKHSALVELEYEMDEHEPGVTLLDEIIKINNDSEFMDNGVQRCLEDCFGQNGWTVRVTRQGAGLWREE